ncbi:MAG TPA: DUF134 domain-containing protein [Candidatus Cloacimonadota bacterium]|nr:DUF134 domain-containing protein [Candidatus Cloacimonadota bacterium]HPS39769.1 DUF134 domain-containing protein [Candidatus Cloacimonadota bacterium]
MPRLKVLRNLGDLPIIKGFRPIWMRANLRQAVSLNLEEYEALRLIDYERKNHEQAATAMNVSRPTFTRIYESARQKLSLALVEGRSLLIEGGSVSLNGSHWYCEACSSKFTLQDPPSDGGPSCPHCHSSQLVDLNACFMSGCRRCRRCR